MDVDPPLRMSRTRRLAVVGAAAVAVTLVVSAPLVVRWDTAPARLASTVAPSPGSATLVGTSSELPSRSATSGRTTSGSTSPTVEGAVPWADLPVDPTGEPSPLPRPTLDPTLPACTAGQLAAKAGDESVMTMGTGTTGITVRRVSGPPCRLDDTVKRLSAATPSGTREDLPTEELTFLSGQPVDLRAASDSGEIVVEYSTRCGSAATDEGGHTTFVPPLRPPLRDFVFELSGGGSLHVASGPLQLGCVGQKVDVSRVGGRPYEPQYADLGLEATITAADHATTGQPFSYVVTLHNRTDKDFPLSPCPNYSQTTKLETQTPIDHALNCAAARPIRAGGSESFAMTIPIPATTQAYASLIWRLRTGGTESILASNTLALEGPTGGEPRQCVASQLTATLDGVDRAMGYEYSSVTIRRVGGEPCSLRDDVKGIYGVFDGGEPIALATTSGPDQQVPATVVLAGPDDAASFEISVMARCANGPAQRRSSPARSLRLMLNPAGDLAVLAHNEAGGLNYGCLPHEGRIYVRAITKAR